MPLEYKRVYTAEQSVNLWNPPVGVRKGDAFRLVNAWEDEKMFLRLEDKPGKFVDCLIEQPTWSKLINNSREA